MQTPVTIVIADDHALFVSGLTLLLKEVQDIVITDIANDGKELLSIMKKELPALVLLDINMPGVNGLEATRHIKQAHRNVKIIILSTYHEEHLIEKARQNGANGYLLKTCSKEELLHAIEQVMGGQACFPSNSKNTANELDMADPFIKQFNLSRRETEIIQLIKKGFKNQQIADSLFLSIYTVETHRKNIMHKLQLNSPAALMKFIMEHNL